MASKVVREDLDWEVGPDAAGAAAGACFHVHPVRLCDRYDDPVSALVLVPLVQRWIPPVGLRLERVQRGDLLH